MVASGTQIPRNARSLLAAAACLLAGLASASPATASNAPAVAAYDSLATIRSDQPLPPRGSSKAEISAAGNEFESFQVAVQAGAAPLGAVRVDPGRTLRGPGGATIPASNMRIYREADYHVTQRSDAEGAAGSWPDGLIPEGDAFYGEDRNAFPVDLAAGQRVTAWIDVLVPPRQRGGVYRGSIRVTHAGGLIARVRIALRVMGFSIPSTSSLRSLFHIKAVTTLPGGDQSLFAAVALNNRISLSNIVPFPDSRFTAKVLPLLEGNDPRVQLPGARLTALDAYHCATDCLEQWRDLAQRYPIVGERFVDYICDEPHSGEDWDECHATAAAADAIWPGVRKLVTTDSAHAPSWATDLSPAVNLIHRDGMAAYRAYRTRGRKSRGRKGGHKSRGRKGGRKNGARKSRSAGRSLWPYTSCMSFSCDEHESSEYNGWPGYVIDQPASQARAMGWLAFVAGATGELYWSTSRSISTAWTNQYLSGGNGDGNLFYPGTPDVIGGVHAIPVESMRLKRIRDGREDYEYLRILATRNRRSEAREVVKELFGAPSVAMQSATVGSAALNKARRKLAALIR